MVFEKTSENRDFEEYKHVTTGDDDDGVSIVSSFMGEHGGQHRPSGVLVDANEPAVKDDTDWEQHNETDRDESILKSLKKLGNVKRKRMSTFILNSMLDSDIEVSLRGIKQLHLKTVKKEKMKINNVYRAIRYIKRRMAIQLARLMANILEHSKNGTYS